MPQSVSLPGSQLGRLLELFNKIKHCRHVARRYDKLAANYLAFVQLASIRLWLRANEFTSWQIADVGARCQHWRHCGELRAKRARRLLGAPRTAGAAAAGAGEGALLGNK
jgi:hypothetical protein